MDKAQRAMDVHLLMLVQKAQDALDRGGLAAEYRNRLHDDLIGFSRDDLPHPHDAIE